MSLREEPRSRSKTWSNYSSRKKEVEVPEVVQIPADAPVETGIIWEYDSVTDEWCRGVVTFRMMKNYFAEGALRTAHMMEIHGDVSPADGYAVDKTVATGKTFKTDSLPAMGLLGDKYVVKLSKTKVPVERYFEDVKMQMVCVELAKKFNQQGTPKKVEFLTAWVLEIPKANGSMWCGLEHYIGGEFKKQSNNHGGVLEPRNTPQAFSHFTWEHTKHNLIVVDLQGVDDDYTDPQVHTKDGVGYGVGNLGRTGIDRFLKTHQCNAICQMLNLPRINTMDSKAALQKLIKGTQQVPFIEDQLGNVTFPHLDVGDNISAGEFQCVQTLTGHVDRVVSLCVTSKYLFSGSSDGTLRVWTLPGLAFDRELNVHRKSVESICANEQYLFTGSADHSIKVWDLATFVLVIALRDHVGEVNAITLTDKSLNFLVSGSFDKNIKVWSLRTFKCVQTLSGHSKCVKALAVSGSILFSGSNDGSIYMWSLKNLSCLFALDAHEGWVKTLAIKDKTLFSGSFDFHIKEWKVTQFQGAEILTDHNDNVNALCLTDKYLISGSDDKSALIWDLATRRVVAVIRGHRLGVQSVVTDGKHIYTGSDDCSIKVWKWFGDK
jgi:myosin-heavy-chain kinase